MKKSFKLLSLAVVIATGIAACKKDNPPEEKKKPQPKHLIMKSLTFKNEIRVYTKDGQITDPAIVAKAIAASGMNSIVHKLYEKGPLIFIDQNTLKMASYAYAIKKNEDQFLFTMADTLSIPTNDLNLIAAPFFKFKGLGKAGTNGKTAYNKQFVAYGDQNEIKLSAVDIYHLRKFDNTPRTESWLAESALNEFDVKGISTLGLRDTLTVREYSYNYSK
ncbi:hypothetical protein DBR43_04810 [Pedobacter sp. KBW06]|uniref:hypothetical protein n=1 Tax=Pedobacter sp. KBW06 TaxID=2153359 RepID=UPI000F598B2D|nr:hypothetical protein [Pedobacter sp. KBW06]RQO74709.1 hypothetical protein DBR43_04810 [Pedobacter sp. KBW06]